MKKPHIDMVLSLIKICASCLKPNLRAAGNSSLLLYPPLIIDRERTLIPETLALLAPRPLLEPPTTTLVHAIMLGTQHPLHLAIAAENRHQLLRDMPTPLAETEKGKLEKLLNMVQVP